MKKPKPEPVKAPSLLDDICAVKRIVADHYILPVAAMTSRDRTEPLATIRQMAMVLASKATGASSGVVAKAFARGDHSTVLHALKTIPDKLETTAGRAASYADLSAKVKAHFDRKRAPAAAK